MADIEKTIGNLQILRTWCAVNPRHGMGLDSGECEKAVGWLDDALELLKKQGPIRRGRWVHIENEYYDDFFRCSECGLIRIVKDGRAYCERCGAKMDGGEKDG